MRCIYQVQKVAPVHDRMCINPMILKVQTGTVNITAPVVHMGKFSLSEHTVSLYE